ncbi:MAG: CinA family nicotinamide mononucleotide deamidase-related protein, partial [Clostridia bacterium]|nr:CinA family nicotinamide mononucleotide deamidase-related protein [Clostridia bacterium]
MTAEIIAVGTELLLGDIVNTNAQFLAKELAALGIGMYAQTVVGDNAARLTDSIQTALSRSDLVILSGGLGPTDDDITRETAAEVFGRKLIYHEDIYEKIVARITRKISETNKRQAFVPEGATVLHNDNGTAPGLWMEQDEKILILLPGPPAELEPMFRDKVKPLLISKTGSVILSETVRLFGIGESSVGETVRDLMENSNPTVAPYVKNGDVTLRITARAETEQEAKSLIRPVKD